MVPPWYFRALQQSGFDTGAVGSDQPETTQWAASAWGPAQDEAFAKAIVEGRWSAVEALNVLIPLDPAFDFTRFETLDGFWAARRVADLVSHRHSRLARSLYRSVEDTLAEMGHILSKDAGRSPYLTPLAGACAEHCPTEKALCLATGVLHQFHRVPYATGLEPILSDAEVRASAVGVQVFLARAGELLQRDATRPAWAALPQCIRTAAEAAMMR